MRDFYDYFYIDQDHLAVVIADVSGKGIPASLFMMRSKESLRSASMNEKDLATVFFKVNNKALAEDLTQETFLRYLKAKCEEPERFLYTIARNLCIDYCARPNRNKRPCNDRTFSCVR